MTEQVYLGVDLGAESGRVMAGLWDGRRMRLEELHRFTNGPVFIAGTARWDILRLWAEIQNGLTLAARRFGRSVASVGVDAWGVDFVLLSKSGELLGQPFHYRDARTRGLMEQASERVPRAEVFRRDRRPVHADQHALSTARFASGQPRVVGRGGNVSHDSRFSKLVPVGHAAGL